MREITIVGQGLAGTLLGLALQERGVPVTVWDWDGSNASRAAAGLIVPVGGKRWRRFPDVERLLPVAVRRYRELENRFGQKLLHPISRLRLFRSKQDLERFQKRLQDPAYRPYFGETVAPGGAGFGLRDDLGGVWLRECYRLDTERLLSQARQRWQEEGRFRLGTPGRVERGVVVFCEGWRVVENPSFGKLPWRVTFGEILTLGGEEFPPFMVQRERWLLPVGGNRYRLGSTYRHRFDRVEPTQEGKEALLAGLRDLFRKEIPPFTLEGAVAGVRIGTADHRPVLGRHPDRPELLIFNGFGSHGALQIPEYAERLADHLLEGRPLPVEVTIDRFLR